MNITNDERCTAVLAYLASFFCTYKVLGTAVSVRTEGEWEYDLWHVEWFRPEGMKYVLPYRTGIGHREAPRPLPAHVKAMNPRSVGYHKWLRDPLYAPRPVAPDVLGPLSSWLLDASCADGYTFKNFCAELGYDPDSMKAHKIYTACQDELDKLQEFFTRDQITHLRDMMQDY